MCWTEILSFLGVFPRARSPGQKYVLYLFSYTLANWSGYIVHSDRLNANEISRTFLPSYEWEGKPILIDCESKI
jgi:hypothetical protein